MKTYLKILSLLFLSVVFPKEIKTDTDYQQLPNDSNKVNLMIEQSLLKTTDSNIVLANEAFHLAESIKFNRGKILSLYSLAINHSISADYDRSIYYLLQSIKLVDELQDESLLDLKAESTRYLGEICRATKDYDKGLEYLFEARNLFNKLNHQIGLSRTYNRLSSIYLEKFIYKECDSVIYYANLSNEIAYKIGFNEVISNNLNILGTYYSGIGQDSLSIPTYKMCLEYFENDDKFSERANVLGNLARVYYKMNMNDSSLYYARLSYNEASRLKVSAFIYSTSYLLFELFKNRFNQLDSAIHYILISIQQMEKIYDEEKIRSITESQIRDEISRKEKEIIERDNKILSHTVIFLSILIVLFFAFFYYFKKNKIQKLANEKLEQINMSKDTFFSIIAHDLKNPIGAFRNLADLLKNEYDTLDDFERKNFAKLMSDSSNSILELLENLLTWSRNQSNRIDFEPAIHDIKFLSNQVISVNKLSADKKRIEIINNIPDGDFAYCDINMVYTILRNLISNSIKFSFSDSKIIIDSEKVIEDNMSKIKISVIDFGTGISEDILDKMFDFSSKVSRLGTQGEKGTGLGMVIVKEFVEKNNGKMLVETEVNKGSTISFTLPINEPAVKKNKYKS